MKVTIEYAAQVKKAAGLASESLNVPERSTVQEVVQLAAEAHGQALSELILGDDGKLHPSILLFLGDDQIAWETAVELHDRDMLTILSPVSGG